MLFRSDSEIKDNDTDHAIEGDGQISLITHLREEIGAMDTRLSYPPTIKELVHGRMRMPLLHATMREALRLQQSYTNSVRLVAPKDGLVIVDVLILVVAQAEVLLGAGRVSAYSP